jgi:hypothetical protein
VFAGRPGKQMRYLWAMLLARLARLFESLLPKCPNCGAHRRIIAFVSDAAPSPG